MSISIFVCDLATSAPELLAYDIPSRDAAEGLIRGIATSFDENGRNPGTNVLWFTYGGRRHEIYARAGD